MTAPSDERKCPSEPSKPAERKTNRLKRKDLRSACVSKSQVFVCYSVPIEYAVIVARAIMLKWTCVERIMVVPIDDGLKLRQITPIQYERCDHSIDHRPDCRYRKTRKNGRRSCCHTSRAGSAVEEQIKNRAILAKYHCCPHDEYSRAEEKRSCDRKSEFSAEEY